MMWIIFYTVFYKTSSRQQCSQSDQNFGQKSEKIAMHGIARAKPEKSRKNRLDPNEISDTFEDFREFEAFCAKECSSYVNFSS